MPVQLLTSLQTMVFSTTNMPTTLSFALRCAPNDTSAGLSVLAACTADVRQWYMQNGLQLNPDKSEALIVGMAHQLRAATSTVLSVTVANVDLPLANDIDC